MYRGRFAEAARHGLLTVRRSDFVAIHLGHDEAARMAAYPPFAIVGRVATAMFRQAIANYDAADSKGRTWPT
jgi:hypothetical protein